MAWSTDDPPTEAELRALEDSIKPLPPSAIPDDPPPHEGAMIDIPFVIEPPDMIVVEVLEALPGRPVTGERLVRSDGTISLGFYGDVHVRGLTTAQAKVKILHHMRKYMTDEVLGLVLPLMGEGLKDNPPKPEPEKPPVPDAPPNLEPKLPPELNPNPIDQKPGTTEDGPSEGDQKPKSIRDEQQKFSRGSKRSGLEAMSRSSSSPQVARGAFASRKIKATESAQEPEPKQPGPEGRADPGVGQTRSIDPADSLRVFVDITLLASKAYYVQGDVSIPGRLPVTGKETVLDALNHAGGLAATAESKDIHLYRPARGGKPAKDYPIDLEAICRGDATANLQIFPDDRLIVGRNAIVKKTVELDRVAASLNSVINSILQYSYGVRSLAANRSPFAGKIEIKVDGQTLQIPSAPATKTAGDAEADMKAWFEFLWDLTDQEGKQPLDDRAIREAILKKLSAPPSAAPEKP